MTGACTHVAIGFTAEVQNIEHQFQACPKLKFGKGVQTEKKSIFVSKRGVRSSVDKHAKKKAVKN